ncbi:hypothetical protein [Niallia sp. NCCP-28]|uniref:hypothetical protein n=1 Tax=Niallia sp. NCCP-28 TaxID=2934712 RepID=UPI00208B3D8B|nr:hypothetical protein [Niallia sp. NCCP-28]GKU82576.1 hypothetical protein NCCP28_19720 [Niallia sp. NCCP-28]
MTEQRIFPNNKEFVLDRYRDEIITRAEWTLKYLDEGYLADDNREKMRQYTSAIIYAMSISRLIYWHTSPIGTPKRRLAKQRAKAIKNKWPNIPSPPDTLRKVRNKLEHFEESMDEWASSDESNIFIDSNSWFDLNMVNIEGIGSARIFRNIDSRGNFNVLGEKVNLDAINHWCIKVIESLK